MNEQGENISVEEAFEQLNTIVNKMESEEITLKESLSLYSEGVALLKSCKQVLDDVEKEMIILNDKGETKDA